MKAYQEIGYFRFHAADYIVFTSVLFLSTLTGVYFGYFRRRKFPTNIENDVSKGKTKTDFGSNTMSEYLLGSRKMKTFPVAMSLVASYISGVTILGTASEVYNYGTQYWLILLPIFFMGIAVATIYLPVFSTLKVGSSYEYLEMRFSSGVRTFASFMFVMDEIFFLPIILYVPAIAFNQVTGANVHMISGIICVICVFYTLIGGIKAVVHTDAWQVLVMFVSVIVVVILGTVEMGGPGEVFNRAAEGGRLIIFDFDTSPYRRQTFWSVTIGGFFYWTSFNSVNQTMVQRYMSLPTKNKAQKSIALFTLGMGCFVSVCCFAGLLIYGFYRRCDPLSAGLVQTDDQLLPIYVMQTVGHLKGVSGLFIAGVFGAALSSLSVVLNSTSAVLLEDIVKGCFKVKLTEKGSSYLVKSSIVVLGIIALAMVFVIEKLDGILSVATSVTAIAAGTTFGMFSLGMLVPWSNVKGAYAGAIAGALMSGWASFGAQLYNAENHFKPDRLPVSVDECPDNMTISTTAPSYDDSDIFPLYRISYHWINPIGVGSVLVVGIIVSFLTGPTKLKKLDADLISPILHRFLPRECFSNSSNAIDLGCDLTRDPTIQTLTHLLGETNVINQSPISTEAAIQTKY